MSEWVEKFLTEISALNYGDNLPSSELKSSGYKVFGANGFIGFNDKYNLEKATVLISCRGEYSGTINLVPAKTFVTNNSIPVVLKNDETDTTFLFYKLQTLRKDQIVSGSAQPQVTINDLKKVKLKVPVEIDEQRKIARILSTADAVIEKTRAAIAKYKAVKQGMLHDLFTRGIDPQTGTLRPHPADAPELYRDSPLGKVPKDWGMETIEYFGEIVTGSTPSTSRKEFYGADYLFVSPADIADNVFITITDKRLTRQGFEICRQLSVGTICVVCIGSTIGKIAVLAKEGCTNQQINSVVPFDIDLSFYLFYAMSYFNEMQFRKETGLQAVPIVNKSRFSTFLLPKTDKPEALEISNRLRAIDRKIQSEQNYLSKLQSIKAGLMADLLSGKKTCDR